MAGLILNVFIDGVMAVLLVITTFYCWKLNKRIKVLQDSKSELANIISQFDVSTQKATRSIGEIHEAAARISENMQHKIDKANYIADDLQFMIEKGNKVADRMDGDAPSRVSPKAAREPIAPVETTAKKTASRKSKDTAAAADASPKRNSAVEEMMSRAKRGRAADTAEAEEGKRPRRQGARLRSKAEQELFEALKAGGGKA